MKSILGVAVVGVLAFLGTVSDPAREMWAPLMVAVVPLLIFMMWPVRNQARASERSGHSTAA